MKNLALIYILLCALSFQAFSSETIQNDWSGGSGLEGPVVTWEDQYYSGYSICTSIDGEITLGAQVDPELHTLNIECGEESKWVDVNSNGYTDVICLHVEGDHLYWLENPITPNAPWIYHPITVKESIKDFGIVIFLDEFFGVAAVYTESN